MTGRNERVSTPMIEERRAEQRGRLSSFANPIYGALRVTTAKASGDLIVTVDVQVPEELTDEQRAAVQAYAAATTVSPRAGMGS